MLNPAQVDLSRGVRYPGWAIGGVTFAAMLIGVGFGLGLSYIKDKNDKEILRREIVALKDQVSAGKLQAHDGYCRILNLVIAHVIKTKSRESDEVLPYDPTCPPYTEVHIR